MSLLQWNDKLSVGIMEIDAQHKKLLGLINAFHDAMKTGTAKQETEGVIHALKDYVALHFTTEEKLMARIAFPGLAEHRGLHQDISRKVEELAREAAEGKTPAVAVARYLTDWYYNHIGKVDMLYAEHFRAMNRR